MNIKPSDYSRVKLNFPIQKMRDLETLNNYKPFIDLLLLYFSTFVLIFFGIKLVSEVSWLFYPLLVFFIAGRQGAFLQLVHEASHDLINTNAKINNFFGSWLTSLAVGVNFNGFTSGHRSHHSLVSTANEPKSDSEKYLIVDFRDPKIYFLFLKDFLGITALKIFLDYGGNKLKKEKFFLFDFFSLKKLSFLLKLCIVQLLILSIFKFNIFYYILFWIYPAMGPHMLLMRIRGIAEHGLSKQMSYFVRTPAEGMYFTRSFLTSYNSYKIYFFGFLEKALIGSFNVHYHHEHHLNARIPYYNLEKFHDIIKEEIKNKIKVPIYEKGYFSAALKTVLVPEEELKYIN
jgi:fatty acid desaturase